MDQTDTTPAPKADPGGYRGRLKRPRWPLLAAIIAGHIGAIYALGIIFAPDFTRSIERDVIAAFNLEAPPPAPEPPAPTPARKPEPDEGAAGDPGKLAVPEPVTAPPPRLPQPSPTPLPPVAGTGAAASAGAREAGEGTGASGTGEGTGSGNRGTGRGAGGAVTRPEHVSGAINNARDFPVPPGGREARRGTEVIVRVIVGVDGRARDCTIYRASPDPEADRITCRLVEERLGFRPARDAAGNPVPAPFYWRQRWF
ncbi:MAG: hypothetical protein V2I27_10695 [Erythrobacter sp.]|jgi:protein TonB|nr:hypothetical protein [Erythrobacter sp.]